MSMQNLIKGLNNIGEQATGDINFKFNNEKNLWVAIGSEISKAKNIRTDNNSFDCNVFKWFYDYWLYIRIETKVILFEIDYGVNSDLIKKQKNYYNTHFIKMGDNYYAISLSLSVFQGDISDNNKTQLFRAEWYNSDKFELKHPQPHWHIYPHKYSFDIHQTFEEFIDLGKEDPDFNDYIGQEKISSKKIIKLNKFHFAMNGQWSENKTDVHSISVESDLINWFRGLLNHLKKELEYVKEK